MEFSLINWVNTHGIEILIGYLFFAAFVGSMPPLKPNAHYMAHWAYGFLHLLSMNLRSAANMLKVQIPDKPDETKKVK